MPDVPLMKSTDERTGNGSTIAWTKNESHESVNGGGGGGDGKRLKQKSVIFDSSAQNLLARSSSSNSSGEQERKTGSSRITLTVLRTGSVKTGKKFLRWMVNYNTVESILLFCSVLIMLGGIMFSSSRFDNNKNQSELETITWTVSFVLVSQFDFKEKVLWLLFDAGKFIVFC